MSEYIKIDGTKIVEHICGLQKEGYIKVPDGFLGTPGMDIHEFDAEWRVRPISERVAGGFIEISPEFKLVGDNLVPKTIKELMDENIVELPNTLKIIGEDVVEKSFAELVFEGIVDRPKGKKVLEASDLKGFYILVDASLQEQLDLGDIPADRIESVKTEIFNERCLIKKEERNRLLSESDWTQMPDAPTDKAAWAVYRQALRDITKQPSWPEVDWPQKPE